MFSSKLNPLAPVFHPKGGVPGDDWTPTNDTEIKTQTTTADDCAELHISIMDIPPEVRSSAIGLALMCFVCYFAEQDDLYLSRWFATY